MAAQDQSLMTNTFIKMASLSTDSKCRFCHTEVKSVSHLPSSCKVLLGEEYYTAQHGVCKYLHWTICKTLNIKCISKYWKLLPERTVESETYTIHMTMKSPQPPSSKMQPLNLIL